MKKHTHRHHNKWKSLANRRSCNLKPERNCRQQNDEEFFRHGFRCTVVGIMFNSVYGLYNNNKNDDDSISNIG